MPATVPTAADAEKLLAAEREADGYVVYILGIPSSAARTMVDSGRPTVLIDDLYGGTGKFLTTYAYARPQGAQGGRRVVTRFEDVVQTVKTFEVIKRLRSSVILDVTERKPEARAQGHPGRFRSPGAQDDGGGDQRCYKKADRAAAQKCANAWIEGARRRSSSPRKEEIGKSGVMYVAMRDLMARHGARAITIDCLRLFYGGKLPAYPCLGFYPA